MNMSINRWSMRTPIFTMSIIGTLMARATR